MKNLIRRLAKALRFSTDYQVAYTYVKVNGDVTLASQTVAVAPWLHADNYRSVIDYVKTQTEQASSTPVITSVTKLGL